MWSDIGQQDQVGFRYTIFMTHDLGTALCLFHLMSDLPPSLDPFPLRTPALRSVWFHQFQFHWVGQEVC